MEDKKVSNDRIKILKFKKQEKEIGALRQNLHEGKDFDESQAPNGLGIQEHQGLEDHETSSDERKEPQENRVHLRVVHVIVPPSKKCLRMIDKYFTFGIQHGGIKSRFLAATSQHADSPLLPR